MFIIKGNEKKSNVEFVYADEEYSGVVKIASRVCDDIELPFFI